MIWKRKHAQSAHLCVSLECLKAATFHTDPAQARASLDILRALDTELVLPGHGSPYHGQIADAAKAALI
jgi:glyoxylase-like metal-dependent hydrolase (beta-lactamase superfamily II)